MSSTKHRKDHMGAPAIAVTPEKPENAILQRKTGSTEKGQPPICFLKICEDIANGEEFTHDAKFNGHISFAVDLHYVWKPSEITVRNMNGCIVDLRSRSPTGEQDKNEVMRLRLRLTRESFTLLKEHYERLLAAGDTELGSLERFYYNEREAMFKFLYIVFCNLAKGENFLSREQAQRITNNALESLTVYTNLNNPHRPRQDLGNDENEDDACRKDRLHVANCLATLLFLAVHIADVDIDKASVSEILSRTMFGATLIRKKRESDSVRIPPFAASLTFAALSYNKGDLLPTEVGKSAKPNTLFPKLIDLTSMLIKARGMGTSFYSLAENRELGFVAIEESLKDLERETDPHVYHFFQHAVYSYIMSELKLIDPSAFLDDAVWRHINEVLCLSLNRNSTICELYSGEIADVKNKWRKPDIEVVLRLLSVVAREVNITECFEKIVPQPHIRQRIMEILVPRVGCDAADDSLLIAGVRFTEALFANESLSTDDIRNVFFDDSWKNVLNFVARGFHCVTARARNFGDSATAFALMKHVFCVDNMSIVGMVLNNMFLIKGIAAKYTVHDLGSAEVCRALKHLVDLQTALLSNSFAEIYNDVKSDKNPSAAYAAMFANVSELFKLITDNERCPCDPLHAYDLIRSIAEFMNVIALSNIHRGKSMLIKEFASFGLKGRSIARLVSFVIHPKSHPNMALQKYIDRRAEKTENKRIKAAKAAIELLKNSLTLVAINNSITSDEEESSGLKRADGESSNNDSLNKQSFLVHFAASSGFMAHATECLGIDSLVPSVFDFLGVVCADFADSLYLDDAIIQSLFDAMLKHINEPSCECEILEFIRKALCAKVPLFAISKDNDTIASSEELMSSLVEKFTNLAGEKCPTKKDKLIILELLSIFASLQFTFNIPHGFSGISNGKFFNTIIALLLGGSGDREDGLTTLCKAKCLEVLLNHTVASGGAGNIVYPKDFWPRVLDKAGEFAQRNVGFPTNDKSAELFSVLGSSVQGNQLVIATALNSAGRRAVGPAMFFFDVRHYVRTRIGFASDACAVLVAYNDFVLSLDAGYLYTKTLTDLAMTCHMKAASDELFKGYAPRLFDIANAVFENIGICGSLNVSNIVSNASLIEIATLLSFFVLKIMDKKIKGLSEALASPAMNLAAKVVRTLCDVEYPHKIISERSTRSITLFEQSSATFRCMGTSASSAVTFEVLLNMLNSLVSMLATPGCMTKEMAAECVSILLPLARKLTDTILYKASPSSPCVRYTLVFLKHLVRLSNVCASQQQEGGESEGDSSGFCLDLDLGRVLMEDRQELFLECEATRQIAYSLLDAMIDNEFFRKQVSTSFLAETLFDDDMMGHGFLNERVLELLTKAIAVRGNFVCVESVTKVLQNKVDALEPFFKYSFLPNRFSLTETKLNKNELHDLNVSFSLIKLFFALSYHLDQWKPESIDFYFTLINLTANSLSAFHQDILQLKNDEKLRKGTCELFNALMVNEIYVLNTMLELLKRFHSAPKCMSISNASDFVTHCSGSVECLVSLLSGINGDAPIKKLCTEAVVKLIAVMNIYMDLGGMGKEERGNLLTDRTRKFLKDKLFKKGSLEAKLMEATF